MTRSAENGVTPLTPSEINDLTQAWFWWRAHGDPEGFYDVLQAVVNARVLPPEVIEEVEP